MSMCQTGGATGAPQLPKSLVWAVAMAAIGSRAPAGTLIGKVGTHVCSSM